MTADDDRYPPISDYALIGDCRSAALVSRSGSIEWLALPRFDSPALFAALLDRRRGGCFRVSPVGEFEVTRRYVDHTNVLETTFRTAGGTLRLTDAMPVETAEDRRRELIPDHELLRGVECVEGEVDVEVVYRPRPDFGRAPLRILRREGFGFVLAAGRSVIALSTDLPLKAEADGRGLTGRVRLRAGECRWLSLTSEEGPAVTAPLGEEAANRIARTRRWWQDWIARVDYDGPWREALIRSALVLKLLHYAPSGAIVAAPTTSLPEEIGGPRNWDYRYCWLRDASLTLRALLDLGFVEEGEAFLGWMLNATRLTLPRLQVLYSVYGESEINEKELPHLDGYRGSKPVRVGNAAHGQFQLDVYGEVVGAAHDYITRGGRLDRSEARMLVGIGRKICELWRRPDAGMWEMRAGPFHNTLSKALCWVALDRLIDLGKRGRLDVRGEDFAQERDEIRRVVDERGWNGELDSFTAELDGDQMDAGLLLLGLQGYQDPASPRMEGTFRRVWERLAHNGFLRRYDRRDGVGGGEGAFDACGFWAAELRARQGHLQEAREIFERQLSAANDVGLLSEEVDTETGEQLGNFPQGFSHIALVNAALAITAAEAGSENEPRGFARPGGGAAASDDGSGRGASAPGEADGRERVEAETEKERT